ncbi:Alkylated DNA repair protein AlkB [Methylophaga frappieri]|uniref:Alkylated DNA repair protein AlkB n=2 Tax=Methylophaga frappieri (strain ATCC BAA-2434 / DSM 25690 / JAM7) TaxID=754477 RepID=I1YES2_METFJ|nr:Alkylated DNA repair protein AlkB [Methylophaga frappieri]
MMLKAYALIEAQDHKLVSTLQNIMNQSPPRRMQTPGGRWMSAQMTNCGDLGWITDKSGYRYTREDPLTGKLWPSLPASFKLLAKSAAALAGYRQFIPDVCLINVYQPGDKMGLHQDRDEQDFTQPIVSVSLGLPAKFQFGGTARNDAKQQILLSHGDVLVWGGAKRLNFHGVLPLKDGHHPLLGRKRINLTFRQAG